MKWFDFFMLNAKTATSKPCVFLNAQSSSLLSSIIPRIDRVFFHARLCGGIVYIPNHSLWGFGII
jgi:hypothetical protein